ncbi:MAG: zinc-dependent metalloprotease [Bacteroidota bacterium]
MRNFLFLLTAIIFCTFCQPANAQKEGAKDNDNTTSDAIAQATNGMKKFDGYFPFFWDESNGKIWLEVPEADVEFLYVNALPSGVGSNDIGLDRGQLGGERVVKFMKSGHKLLLIQPNYRFRAVSDNPAESKSVEEAFAQSVLWGFTIHAQHEGRMLIDATDFIVRDAHDVVGRLESRKQGNYKLDKSRSSIYLPSCKNFPKNTELEGLTTFTGKPKGGYIRSVTPTPSAVTVRQHHSFVELPDDNYTPRVMDPRCGYFGISYQDYATPIEEPLVKKYINRHRLEKKDPSAAISEAVEPIVYYLDPGAPEPVKSALLDGARWWNEAFEAAGYKDAFIVKVLPEDVDPLDVRYNVIQWVHRSTRGWSYGGSVIDPRTGEIIKGHVSLGSLRVRQDYLIAQGLLSPFEEGKAVPDEMIEMALARLRQLSAHEIGHTIGIAHNFAASVNNRASVMDYPHPYIELVQDGDLDFTEAYDTKIGEWDKRTVIYGYQDFPEGVDEAEALNKILQETSDMGLYYISDQDARPQGGAHPGAHLWDNGEDAVKELNRIMTVRVAALERFGQNSIPKGTAASELERVLVPLYLSHRYQVEAAVKLVGGVDYNYAVRGDGRNATTLVSAETNENALNALLNTLDPSFLTLSEEIVSMIPPPAYGHSRGREHFKNKTGPTLDPITIAESSAAHTLSLLLNPQRLGRVVEHSARHEGYMSLESMIDHIFSELKNQKAKNGLQAEVKRSVEKLLINNLLSTTNSNNLLSQAKAILIFKIKEARTRMERLATGGNDVATRAHYTFLVSEIDRYFDNPTAFKAVTPPKLPDGSPIGCGATHFHHN